MHTKVFWFALNCFILNNYYLVTETSGNLILYATRNELKAARDTIFHEKEKLVPISKRTPWGEWKSYHIYKSLSTRASIALQKKILEELKPNEIIFSLYNRENPNGENFTVETAHEIVLPEKEAVKVICHGWGGDLHAYMIEIIKDAYLENLDVNVIAMDWNVKAGTFIYPESAVMTKPVGEVVAKVIDTLVSKNYVFYKDFHFIGHSLGAHVGGFVGRNTKELIGRITGLDPALPGFSFVEIAGGRLSRYNAHFVDVIHTCVHVLGTSFPLGQVDFYPNGGSPFQPGCSQILKTSTVSCSHTRAVEYFAESIKKGSDFLAVKCDNWNSFTNESCYNEYTQMGEKADPKATGIYYLQTNGAAPFFLGPSGIHYHKYRH